MNSFCKDTITGKHGKFQFFSKDYFIGKSFKEYGEYSEIELQLLLNFIKSGDTVLDIGSNIGGFTIPFSKKVGSTGQVFAFEPQPEIFKILRKNIVLNEAKNIKSFPVGLSNKKETIKLKKIKYDQIGNFGGVTLKDEKQNLKCVSSLNEFYNVKIKKLDNFDEIKKCNLIKIDVEGMEINTLEGAKEIIKKNRPILFLENDLNKPKKLNHYVINKGYEIFWVLTSLYNKDNFFSNKSNFFVGPNGMVIVACNIICFPKEKKININLEKINRNSNLPSKINLEYIT